MTQTPDDTSTSTGPSNVLRFRPRKTSTAPQKNETLATPTKSPSATEPLKKPPGVQVGQVWRHVESGLDRIIVGLSPGVTLPPEAHNGHLKMPQQTPVVWFDGSCPEGGSVRDWEFLPDLYGDKYDFVSEPVREPPPPITQNLMGLVPIAIQGNPGATPQEGTVTVMLGIPMTLDIMTAIGYHKSYGEAIRMALSGLGGRASSNPERESTDDDMGPPSEPPSPDVA